MEINEEIKQKMVQYLQSFEAGLKQAGEFSAEQAPLVVQEFLAWEFWYHAAMSVCFGIALGIVMKLVTDWWPKLDQFDRIGFGMVTAIAILGFSVGTVTSAFGAAKVAIAPRIVVLEKISELVK